MIRRGLALGLVLGLASVAQAGVVIDLQPTTPAPYAQGSTVTVEAYLYQAPAGVDQDLRLVEMRFTSTDPALTVQNFLWDAGFVVPGHYKDEDLVLGPSGVAVAYTYVNPAELGPNPAAQVTLPGDGTPVLVATMEVVMPGADGTYTLDVANATAPNDDLDATVCYGFGLDVGDPVTCMSPGSGVTGGTVDLEVSAAPLAVLTEASPAAEFTLPRTQGNVVKLTFDRAVPAVPGNDGEGELLIREMLVGGGYGGDENVGGTFNIFIDGVDPNVLWIQDSIAAPALANETWYSFQNDGSWAGVASFEMQYPVVFGNVNDSVETDVTDVTQVMGNRADPAPFDALEDLNASGAVDVTDVTATLGNRGSTKPAKPF